MRRLTVAVLTLATAAAFEPAAQARTDDLTGIPTETQRRLAQGDSDQVPWDILGLLGLFGLLGLRSPHSEDSYHPASVE